MKYAVALRVSDFASIFFVLIRLLLLSSGCGYDRVSYTEPLQLDANEDLPKTFNFSIDEVVANKFGVITPFFLSFFLELNVDLLLF